MNATVRVFLVSGAILAGSPVAALLAQQPRPAPPPAPGAPPSVEAPPAPAPTVVYNEPDAQQTREQFRNVLRQHPPTLWQILRLDPALLNDAEYLAPYPALAAFLREHPEIARNPTFYVGTPETAFIERPRSAATALEGMFEALMVIIGLTGLMVFLAWIINTAVEYRRWLRLSKVQTDTHTKLVDRLTANDELLAYVQSAAGQRFLQGGPAPADTPRGVDAPYGRILWSVQAGTVVMLLGGGFLFISRRFAADPEFLDASPIMFMLGVLAVTIGAGFLLSSLIAYIVSQRLGLLRSGTGTSNA